MRMNAVLGTMVSSKAIPTLLPTHAPGATGYSVGSIKLKVARVVPWNAVIPLGRYRPRHATYAACEARAVGGIQVSPTTISIRAGRPAMAAARRRGKGAQGPQLNR